MIIIVQNTRVKLSHACAWVDLYTEVNESYITMWPSYASQQQPYDKRPYFDVDGEEEENKSQHDRRCFYMYMMKIISWYSQLSYIKVIMTLGQ